MTSNDSKTGPITREDLLSIWRSSTDVGYHKPIEAAGEGRGFEAHTQEFEQLARVAKAIDRSTQSMYLRPWSGMTDESARGERRATVTCSIARSGFVSTPLILLAGKFLVSEETTDWGENGPLLVRTGRRYIARETIIFCPGDGVAQDIIFHAEKPGYGYNNPFPETITAIDQAGAGFENDRASVVVSIPPVSSTSPQARADLVVDVEADVVIPEHVGQYILFTSGSNAGTVARAIDYLPPVQDELNPNGGTLSLAITYAVVSDGVGTANFIPGELVSFDNAGVVAYLRFLGKRDLGTSEVCMFDLMSGVFLDVVGALFTGLQSGATMFLQQTLSFPVFVNEASTATWRVVDWITDWKITSTNAASPAGGRLGMLDALGAERNIARASGESDDIYADRVAKIADVVTPNAIRRAVNRVLSKYGTGLCLREVGGALLPGLFFDAIDPLNADPKRSSAYDMDEVIFTGGSVVGTFIDGEPLTQTSGAGIVSTGRAAMNWPAATGPFPAAMPAKTLEGAVGVSGSFVGGAEVRGEWSGATITPVSVSTGLRPEDRFKMALDLVEFRGMFLVGVPRFGFGEYGFAYDAGQFGAYDLTGTSMMGGGYDGFPTDLPAIYRAIWQAIDEAHGGGVSFDLYEETIGCF